ncbi:MAG: M23 family metallopeptidase [Elusimicrobia bacterium]|nr:M23 family metallopeptidase [Elusimicrobiota bacterium]
MIIWDKLKRVFSKEVSVLVIPHADWPLWKMHFSVSFLSFMFFFWTGLTIWAGFVVGRHLDYWVTKADNQMLKAKVAYFAKEVDQSRDFLQLARTTDERLRLLLGMQSRKAIIEEEGIGGPLSQDRFDLKRIWSGKVSEVPQPLIHKRAREIHTESVRRLASFQEIAWYVANARSLYQSTPNIWPTEGRITSPFGYRFSPFGFYGEGENGEFHSGIDLANQADTPVYATAEGVVRVARWSSGYGMMMVVDHGYGFSTLYGHTSRVLVKEGNIVKRGQPIAYMGTTGRSTGDHLHYEVWLNGKPVNPLKFLKVGEKRSGMLKPRRSPFEEEGN